MRTLLAGGLLTGLFIASAAHAAETTAAGCDAMVGVWEYIAPSAPGHAIIARQGAKYLGIFVNTMPQPYGGRTPQPAAGKGGRADAYSVAGAWEYACEADAGKLRLTLRWLYSSYQPQDVGSEVILEVELAGRQGKWWFLGPDGKRGTAGAGRLIR